MLGMCLKAESLPVCPVDIPRKQQLISREVMIKQIFRETIYLSGIRSLGVFVILQSVFTHSPTHSRMLLRSPLTASHADARISTGE